MLKKLLKVFAAALILLAAAWLIYTKYILPKPPSVKLYHGMVQEFAQYPQPHYTVYRHFFEVIQDAQAQNATTKTTGGPKLPDFSKRDVRWAVARVLAIEPSVRGITQPPGKKAFDWSFRDLNLLFAQRRGYWYVSVIFDDKSMQNVQELVDSLYPGWHLTESKCLAFDQLDNFCVKQNAAHYVARISKLWGEKLRLNGVLLDMQIEKGFEYRPKFNLQEAAEYAFSYFGRLPMHVEGLRTVNFMCTTEGCDDPAYAYPPDQVVLLDVVTYDITGEYILVPNEQKDSVSFYVLPVWRIFLTLDGKIYSRRVQMDVSIYLPML